HGGKGGSAATTEGLGKALQQVVERLQPRLLLAPAQLASRVCGELPLQGDALGRQRRFFGCSERTYDRVIVVGQYWHVGMGDGTDRQVLEHRRGDLLVGKIANQRRRRVVEPAHPEIL